METFLQPHFIDQDKTFSDECTLVEISFGRTECRSVAFFGSATLIVLAGIFSIFVKLDAIHAALTGFELVRNTSPELFIFSYLT